MRQRTLLWTTAMVLVAVAVLGREVPNTDGWRAWRGSVSSGCAIDTGRTLVESFEEARHLWTSDERIPGTYEGDARGPVPRLKARIPGGYASPIVAGERVYLAYYVPNGPVFDKGVCDRHVGGGGMGREQWYTDADDVILCLDAETGKTLWKRVFVEEALNLEGGFNKGGCQLTPCIADGRVYAIGPGGDVYCVDAETGHPVWQADVGIRQTYQQDLMDGSRELGQLTGGRNDFGGCPIVVDGVLAVSDHQEYKGGPRTMWNWGGNGLLGFDGRTGARLWYVPGAGGDGMLGSSPLWWRHGDTDYILACGNDGTFCIAPRTGKVVWQDASPRFDNAAATADDRLVCNSREGGLTCYALTPKGVERQWNIGDGTGFSSPAIYRGHVYALMQSGLHCIELATGKIVGKAEQAHVTGSLALADGRLFVADSARGKAGMNMVKADPTDFRRLGPTWPVPFANSTTPATADGRVYFRGRDRMICYDLLKP